MENSMEAMNGSLDFDSEKGQGTMFHIKIPLDGIEERTYLKVDKTELHG